LARRAVPAARRLTSLRAIVLCTPVAIALHSSLQHEVTHGHPFNERRLGEALVFGSLNLVIPICGFATRIWRITWTHA
jgi:fatty acid desaturase